MELLAETKNLVAGAIKAAVDALAEDVVAMDVSARLPFVDAFVLATADNARHLRAVVDAVTHGVREKTGESPHNVEGDRDSTWLVIDYGSVVVHVFLPEAREFYALDKLWADSERILTESL